LPTHFSLPPPLQRTRSPRAPPHNVVQDDHLNRRDSLVGILFYVLSDVGLRAFSVAILGSALGEYALLAALLVWVAAVLFVFFARAVQVRTYTP
jgi:hypothetical protein